MINNFQIAQLEEIKNEEKPVILKFTADWCPGCKQLAPVIEHLADENREVIFYDVDVDRNLDFAQQTYGVMSIPTLILLKKGKEVDRVTAPEPSEKAILEFIHKNL
ncbi:thiol reductase thioredoxin [Tetzosporium hominis]|uniref:Thioredoxin n=1 Tax=Tetzosporium hominis TaxID=2020506 RepID=A0A264W3T9_9BACL|nr:MULTISPECIES: thioredoxin family protein [Planococcaceae]OZS78240.1 thiol reductase thioredoxin [Tetzosporium hominis]